MQSSFIEPRFMTVKANFNESLFTINGGPDWDIDFEAKG